MAYCPNCGSKLVDGDVFCGNCGKRIEAAAAPCEPVFSQAPTEESESPTKETKPKSGITRCPACGEIVDKNAVICPSCGFGIRDVADGSIALLSQKLDLIESKRPQKRKKDENGTISATDERKISLIRSWPIPTNKDDLIEFAAMASGNCVAPQTTTCIAPQKTHLLTHGAPNLIKHTRRQSVSLAIAKILYYSKSSKPTFKRGRLYQGFAPGGL